MINFIKKNKLLIITILLFIILYLYGAILYGDRGFTKIQFILNLFINNAALIIAVCGMTLVLITGGIDISVGSVVGMICMLLAYLLEIVGLDLYLALIITLIVGILFGIFQGVLIAYFKIQPFIVTLAGMFLARGITAMISSNMISITNESFLSLAKSKIVFEFISVTNRNGIVTHPYIYFSVVLAILVVILITILLKFTRFGKSIYAVGGDSEAAASMGIDASRVKFKVYVLNGILVTLAGVAFCLNSCGGFVEQARGFEMDAIASTVMGGTLLTGGVGSVIGSLFGVLTKGLIESLVTFNGSFSSWWARIIIALFLCGFIVMQTIFNNKERKNRK